MKNFSPVYTMRQGLRPPELYEYFLDNFWFKAAGLGRRWSSVALQTS